MHSESLWESSGSWVLITCLWRGRWQEKALWGKKAQGMAQLLRLGGEKRSHVAWPVSFQQDLIKASNTVGRGSRAGVSVAQRRLSAVKPDRALGRETQLSPSSWEVEGTSWSEGWECREVGTPEDLPESQQWQTDLVCFSSLL